MTKPAVTRIRPEVRTVGSDLCSASAIACSAGKPDLRNVQYWSQRRIP